MEQAKIDLIVIDAKCGDNKAFEQLFSLFHQSAIRYAYKIIADPEIAQEATQNSWIKVAKNLSKLNDPRAFKSWLFQLVHWQTIDLIRKQNSQKKCLPLEETGELIAPEKPATNNELPLYISQLEAIDKQAIHLFYLEEMSLIEISTVLDTPVGTIKSRLNRARKLLKNKLIEKGLK